MITVKIVYMDDVEETYHVANMDDLDLNDGFLELEREEEIVMINRQNVRRAICTKVDA